MDLLSLRWVMDCSPAEAAYRHRCITRLLRRCLGVSSTSLWGCSRGKYKHSTAFNNAGLFALLLCSLLSHIFEAGINKVPSSALLWTINAKTALNLASRESTETDLSITLRLLLGADLETNVSPSLIIHFTCSVIRSGEICSLYTREKWGDEKCAMIICI